MRVYWGLSGLIPRNNSAITSPLWHDRCGKLSSRRVPKPRQASTQVALLTAQSFLNLAGHLSLKPHLTQNLPWGIHLPCREGEGSRPQVKHECDQKYKGLLGSAWDPKLQGLRSAQVNEPPRGPEGLKVQLCGGGGKQRPERCKARLLSSSASGPCRGQFLDPLQPTLYPQSTPAGLVPPEVARVGCSLSPAPHS